MTYTAANMKPYDLEMQNKSLKILIKINLSLHDSNFGLRKLRLGTYWYQNFFYAYGSYGRYSFANEINENNSMTYNEQNDDSYNIFY